MSVQAEACLGETVWKGRISRSFQVTIRLGLNVRQRTGVSRRVYTRANVRTRLTVSANEQLKFVLQVDSYSKRLWDAEKLAMS